MSHCYVDVFQCFPSLVSLFPPPEVVVRRLRQPEALCQTGSAVVHSRVCSLRRVDLQGGSEHFWTGHGVFGLAERSFNRRGVLTCRICDQLHFPTACRVSVPEHVVMLIIVLIAPQGHALIAVSDEHRWKLLEVHSGNGEIQKAK